MPNSSDELKTFLKTLKPKQDIPFSLVVETLSGKRVLPITESQEDKTLLANLKKATIKAGKKANEVGIFTRRPNEAGNKMEPFLRDALNKLELHADIPKNSLGKKQATGYPDIYLKDSSGRNNYVEVKTHEFTRNITEKGMRAFYISPPKPNKSKIIYDARHLIVAYGLERIRRNNSTCFIPKNWKIASIHNMKVNLKYEFNTNSAGMYRNAILIEGQL